nr:LCP family protein [Angustibacter aerolatus]
MLHRVGASRGRHVAAPKHGPVVRAVRGVLVGSVGVLVLGLLVGTVVVRRLEGNITATDITGALGNLRPRAQGTKDPNTNLGPMNILLMGSDNRSDLTDASDYGAATEGARSDTTLVVHLSADRRNVVVVSIPRDSMVPMPRLQGPRRDAAGREGRAVQRRVLARRRGVHGEDRRGEHRHPHRPLRGAELRRVQADGRRARRGGRLPHPAGEGRQEPPRPAGRHHEGQGQPGPGVRSGPAHRRRVRHQPHRPAAGVPVGRRARGDEQRAAAAPRPAAGVPRRRHEVADHRPRPGQRAAAVEPGAADQEREDVERAVRDGADPRVPARPEPGRVDAGRRRAVGEHPHRPGSARRQEVVEAGGDRGAAHRRPERACR